MKYVMLFLLLVIPRVTQAEIFRQTAKNESGQTSSYSCPKLKAVKGWAQDLPASFQLKANLQVPDGFTFSTAESVIYARAVSTAEVPEIGTLDQFIEGDKVKSRQEDPNLKIIDAGTLTDKKGRVYKVLAFQPGDGGNWEQVAYSEEVDNDHNPYYLIFALSSRSETGYKAAQDVFKEFIVTYE